MLKTSFGNSPIFTPNSLANLGVWYDGANTPLGAVASWTDSSGNGYHATQATGSKQPICTANQQNGKNTLLFTATGSQFLFIPSGLFNLNEADNTVFAVTKRNAETGLVFEVFSLVQVGIATRTVIAFRANGDVIYRNGALDSTAIFTGNNNIIYSIICGRRNGSNDYISVNNSTESSAGNATGGTVDRSTIGGTAGTQLFLDGGVAEFIIYRRSLTTTERSQIYSYLSNKWNIPIT